MNQLLHKYGFYKVGEEKIRSKVLAFLRASETNQSVHWNFNEDVFEKLNWGVEPTESLDQLYAERARQLRQEYDHVVIHFSGGWDSGNIMETFIRNNLRVDEIFIRGPYDHLDKSAVQQTTEFFYAEIFTQSIPLANYIKEKYYPDIKITVKDTKQLTVDLFAKNKNWIELGSSNLNVGNLYKSDYDLLNKDWQKMAEKGKKICHVIGVDKPRIRLMDNRYYFCFLDIPTIDFCNDRISDIDLPIYNEMFYWSPECGKMLIKQGHVIKKYLKQNTNSSIIKNDWNISDAKMEERKFKWHEEIGNCVYKRTLPHIWKTPKTLNEIHNEYLSWFWKDTNTDYFKNWNNGLEYIFQNVDKQLLDFQYNKKSKLKGCWSRLYDLGT